MEKDSVSVNSAEVSRLFFEIIDVYTAALNSLDAETCAGDIAQANFFNLQEAHDLRRRVALVLDGKPDTGRSQPLRNPDSESGKVTGRFLVYDPAGKGFIDKGVREVQVLERVDTFDTSSFDTSSFDTGDTE